VPHRCCEGSACGGSYGSSALKPHHSCAGNCCCQGMLFGPLRWLCVLRDQGPAAAGACKQQQQFSATESLAPAAVLAAGVCNIHPSFVHKNQTSMVYCNYATVQSWSLMMSAQQCPSQTCCASGKRFASHLHATVASSRCTRQRVGQAASRQVV
jgi:hypothetical protein